MKKTNGGFTLVEALVGLVIFSIVVVAVPKALQFMTVHGQRNNDKIFATQKAIQMMEELRGLLESLDDTAIGVLDDYDNGTGTSFILTTKKEITQHGDPLSDNRDKKFKRQIRVIKIPNELSARRIQIRVMRSKSNEALAEITSVLRTIGGEFEPTQVFDTYFLNVENIDRDAKGNMDSIIRDLQNRNPGLEFRSHWITRMAYGRDPFYAPVSNGSVPAADFDFNGVYIYPDFAPNPQTPLFDAGLHLYAPNFIKGRLRLRDEPIKPAFYTLADPFNHAVRGPDEVSMYNQQKTAAAAAGQPVPEISVRLFLDEINKPQASHPFENALVLNTSDGTLPMPAMRNYSDPAKDKIHHENMRAVVHPEKLEYTAGAEVTLRVYTFTMTPNIDEDATLDFVTITFTNANLNSTNVHIERCWHESLHHSHIERQKYTWEDADNPENFEITHPDINTTRLVLKDSPLRHPEGAFHKGLDAGKRLYGLEYIPATMDAVDFDPATINDQVFEKDLTDGHDDIPKNTARWRIRIDAGALPNGQYTIETKMGKADPDFPVDDPPTNLSRSYVWVGESAPASEKFQFLGDPRHMPYADIKDEQGYNWFFRHVDGFDDTYDGWKVNQAAGADRANIDVPRYHQLYREGLMNIKGIFADTTAPFNSEGMGGMIGAGRHGYTLIQAKPWEPAAEVTTDAKVYEWGNSHIGSPTVFSKRIIREDAANGWVSLPWIGEIYPESKYGYWSAPLTQGNLPPGEYYRAKHTDSNGLYPNYDPVGSYAKTANASFMNGNNGSGFFGRLTPTCDEDTDTCEGKLTSEGQAFSEVFNIFLIDPALAKAPFKLNSTNDVYRPDEWNASSYSDKRTQTSLLSALYQFESDPSWTVLGIIKIARASKAAYMYYNTMGGFKTVNAAGVVESITASAGAHIRRMVLSGLVQTFMEAGVGSSSDRVPQLPRVSISHPTTTDEHLDPQTIEILWDLDWKRWDGKKYTDDYSDSHSETTPLIYFVKYSNNNGKTWKFLNSDLPATPGDRDTGTSLSSQSITWNVGSLPSGNYIIRVEAYRQNIRLHYSYHQRRIFIQRNVS